jgi:hypothetical protein
MKLCTKCEVIKESSEFHKRLIAKDGLQSWCKICLRADNKRMEGNRYKNGPSIIRDAKVCQRCMTKKPVSQFPKKGSSADGYASYCKPCWVIKIRGYQLKGKL